MNRSTKCCNSTEVQFTSNIYNFIDPKKAIHTSLLNSQFSSSNENKKCYSIFVSKNENNVNSNNELQLHSCIGGKVSVCGGISGTKNDCFEYSTDEIDSRSDSEDYVTDDNMEVDDVDLENHDFHFENHDCPNETELERPIRKTAVRFY